MIFDFLKYCLGRKDNMSNAVANKLYSKFREDGLRCCILDCRSGSSGMRICNAQMLLVWQNGMPRKDFESIG